MNTNPENKLDINTNADATFTFNENSTFTLASIATTPTVTMMCPKSGKSSTIDFSDGMIKFKGEIDGTGIVFLNWIHGYMTTRTSELYKELLTYKGLANNAGEYLADEEASKGLFPEKTESGWKS